MTFSGLKPLKGIHSQIRLPICEETILRNPMNTPLKSARSAFSLAAVVALAASASHAATLVIIDDIPVADLLQTSSGEETPQGTASGQATFGYRNADAAGTDGTRGRGQSLLFSTGSGDSYAISSLSVSLGTSADDAGFRPDGDLHLTVFEWDNATNADDFSVWTVDTGASGGTELFSGSFSIDNSTSLLNTQLASISFGGGELTLVDGVAYGFFFHYTLDNLLDGSSNPLNEDVTITFDVRQDAAVSPAGALLNTNVAASFGVADNGESSGRDMNYFLTGTAIPEPSIALLGGLGLLGLLRRRRG